MKLNRCNKYSVAPRAERTCDGIVFASKAEMLRYVLLRGAENDGAIRNLKCQPHFDLGCPATKYVADFTYLTNDGVKIVEDVKGAETYKFRHDKRLWKINGVGALHIMALRRGKWVTKEIVRGGSITQKGS